VYAPADGAFVVVAGSEDDSAGLAAALSRLLGGIGVLGLASVVLDRWLRRPGGPGYAFDGGESARSEEPVNLSTTATNGDAELTRTVADEATPKAVETVTPVTSRTAAETAAQAGGGSGLLATVAGSPGTLFFLGGVVVLLAGFALWTLRRR
jgi:hypothetical protein